MIEVVQINDHLQYFYWGRHPSHASLDMRLGGGCFALHRGNAAVVIDAMAQPGQAEWVKDYLEKQHRIRSFRLVVTHWHIDHVVGNHLYGDGAIIGHRHTRDRLLELAPKLERGEYAHYEAFPVVPPNVTFEGELDLWLDDLLIQLREFSIHERGHVCAVLPQDRILLAADLLEDPLWFLNFRFASPQQQLAELDRLAALDVDRIYPCHGSIEVMRGGGYGKELVRHNAQYLRRLLDDLRDDKLPEKPAESYLGDALGAGELKWWQPYEEVHAMNRTALEKWAQRSSAR